MALSSPPRACLSLIQAFFRYLKTVLFSIIRYRRFGPKRITTTNDADARKTGDLSHHLCRETRERKPNAIKNVWRMAQAKGPGKVITLANGKQLPHG